MADYSSFLFNALDGVGDAFVDNRNKATQVAINNRDYARQLGLDEVAAARDQRDFDFRKTEAARDDARADPRQRAASRADISEERDGALCRNSFGTAGA